MRVRNKRGADAASARSPEAAKPKKLSYKDQRDWDTLEARILTAETELAELEAKTHDRQLW